MLCTRLSFAGLLIAAAVAVALGAGVSSAPAAAASIFAVALVPPVFMLMMSRRPFQTAAPGIQTAEPRP